MTSDSSKPSVDGKTAAVWHDSDVSRRREAVLWFEGARVFALNVDGDRREAAMETVEISSRLGNIPRRIVFPDGVSLAVEDNDFIDAAFRRCRKPTVLLHRLESRWRWLAAIAAIAAATVFAFVNWGVPMAAGALARVTPQEILMNVSDEVYQNFISFNILNDSRLEKEAANRANEIFAEVLADTGGGGGDYRMRLKLHRIGFGGGKDSDDANAFALPDGLIVAGDRLLGILSDEEFAVVMAHEIGHVHRRHGMRSFLQSIGLFAFISFAFGDPSFFLAGGVGLLNLKYSRDFEREADCFAYQYIVHNDLPDSLLGEALQKMEDDALPKDPILQNIIIITKGEEGEIIIKEEGEEDIIIKKNDEGEITIKAKGEGNIIIKKDGVQGVIITKDGKENVVKKIGAEGVIIKEDGLGGIIVKEMNEKNDEQHAKRDENDDKSEETEGESKTWGHVLEVLSTHPASEARANLKESCR